MLRGRQNANLCRGAGRGVAESPLPYQWKVLPHDDASSTGLSALFQLCWGLSTLGPYGPLRCVTGADEAPFLWHRTVLAKLSKIHGLLKFKQACRQVMTHTHTHTHTRQLPAERELACGKLALLLRQNFHHGQHYSGTALPFNSISRC